MYKTLFKLFITIAILLTNVYAGNSEDISILQNELTDIKIELSEIKTTLNFENKNNKIKEIEKSIKDLEAKFHKNNIEKDFQKYDEVIKRQDARISDINSNVNADITLYSSIVGLFFILISILSYKVSSNESEETLKKWIDEKADKEFQPKADEYLKQIENKGDMLLKEFEDKANMQHRNHNKLFDNKMEEIDLMKSSLSKEAKEKNDSDVKAIEETHKDTSEYTFDEWYSKYIQKYFEPDYEKALEYINKSLENSKNDISEAKALYSKALTLGKLERTEEEIKEYDRVIDKFIKSENDVLLEKVVKALVNKGVTLGELKRNEESLIEYDRVIDKFIKSENKVLLEAVAIALMNRVETLLIEGKEISYDLKLFEKLFFTDENKMMRISILEILHNSQKSNQDKFMEEWQEKYKEHNLKENNLATWGFKELEIWKESMEDEDVKQRVEKYIDIFKTKL